MGLTRRQQAILHILSQREAGAATRELITELQKIFDAVARVTVIRDMDILLKLGLVKRIGKGRGVRYQERIANSSLRLIHPDIYFSVDDAERQLLHARYHPSALSAFSQAFTREEYMQINTLNALYAKRIAALPSGIIRKEMERFTTEFSWKSSRIEGNTYSILDTERLLKEREEAEGHPHKEAQMILNHKAALESICAHPNDYSSVSLRTVEQLHALIVKDMGVQKGLRSAPVGILGTRYRPMGIRSQLQEAFEQTLEHINAEPWAPAKSLIAFLMIAYIQPFEDGNKRTARLLGNALLIAGHCCPLSFRSINEKEYKKAVILFYEQHNIRYFKQLFIEQFVYAVEHYFVK